MREIIARVDEGLSAGAQAMRERSDQTEERLRTLIERVDEGLSASAAALQDTLSSTAASITPLNTQGPLTRRSPGGRPSSQERRSAASAEDEAARSEADVLVATFTSDQLIESWD